MEPIDLILPYPPSVNSYWRHPSKGRLAGRHLLSAEGRAYREAIGWKLLRYRALNCQGPLEAVMTFYPPDYRQRDLDNVLKALLDGLQHGGMVDNDNQFRKLTLEWGERHPGGAVHLITSDYESCPPKFP